MFYFYLHYYTKFNNSLYQLNNMKLQYYNICEGEKKKIGMHMMACVTPC